MDCNRGGTTITLTGEFAHSGSPVRVKLNCSEWTSSDLVATIQSQSQTQMTITTPAIPGNVQKPLTVGFLVSLNSLNWISIPNQQFVYHDQVTISGLSSTIGPAGMATPITIYGGGFLDVPTITASFSGTTVSCSYVTSSAISCTTPVLPVTTSTIEVALNAIEFSTGSTVQYAAVFPSLIGVTPSSGLIAGGTSITIRGTNLLNSPVSGSLKLRFQSDAVTPAVVMNVTSATASQIVVTTPSFTVFSLGITTAAGFHDVPISISSNNGQSFTANDIKFRLFGDPEGTQITPDAAVATGGTQVQLVGKVAATADATKVRIIDSAGWQSSDLDTTTTSSGLAFTIPQYLGSLSLPRALGITIAPNGQQYSRVSANVTVFNLPTISSITPTSKQPGSFQSVTITGTGFIETGSVVVELGTGNRFTPISVTDTSIVIVSPDTQAQGEYSIRVSLDGGQHFATGSLSILFRVIQTVAVCPANTEASTDTPATIEECTCKAEFYQPEARPGVACVPCPTNGFCAGRLAQPVPRPGFFSTGSNNKFVFTECAIKSACKGGNTSACAPGYTGRLCASCIVGYYQLGNLCEPCNEGSNGSIILLAVLYIAYIAWVRHFARNKSRTKVRTKTQMKRKGKRSTVSVAALAVTHLQVISTFASFRLNWPAEVQAVLNFFSLANFNLETAAPECSFGTVWTFEFRFWITMALPLIVGMGFLLRLGLEFVHWQWVKHQGEQFAENHPGLCAERNRELKGLRGTMDGIRAWIGRKLSQSEPVDVRSLRFFVNENLFTLGLLYIALCARVLQVFDCTQVSEGLIVLDAAPDELCWTTGGMHERLLLPGIAFLILYVIGIPALFLGIMLGGQDRNVRLSDAFQEKYSTVFKKFSDRFHWFESVVLLRKGAIVAINLFANSQPVLQGVLAIFVLVGSLWIQSSYRPYATAQQNRLEILLLAASYLLLLCGLVFVGVPLSSEETRGWGAIALSIASCVVMACGWYVYHDIRGRIQKVRGKKTRKDEVYQARLELIRELGPMIQTDDVAHIVDVVDNWSVDELESVTELLVNDHQSSPTPPSSDIASALMKVTKLDDVETMFVRAAQGTSSSELLGHLLVGLLDARMEEVGPFDWLASKLCLPKRTRDQVKSNGDITAKVDEIELEEMDPEKEDRQLDEGDPEKEDRQSDEDDSDSTSDDEEHHPVEPEEEEDDEPEDLTDSDSDYEPVQPEEEEEEEPESKQ